jgi:hypothetical protein
MQQEHQPHHVSTFNSGADTDTEKELLGSQPATGDYYDARNARSVSYDGKSGAMHKIGGEVVKYQNNILGGANYECKASISINNQVVEIWTDNTVTLDSLIRVNGTIVLQSPLFDMLSADGIQVHKNENCIGGELFLTNFRTPPMILNVKDMVDSLILDPLKYFSGFDPKLYEINLSSPLDIPVFVELVNVGGGGGLPVGEYQYSIRYTSKEGDRTNWSYATPPIPVVQVLSSESKNRYPYVKTRGGRPDPSSKTGYGIKLRFRVTNLYNYDFIEIRRVAYNQGAGTTYVPAPMLIAKVDITNQEISVREFIDPIESNDVQPLNDTEGSDITYVEAAKTIRYFDKRTVLMNVKLASRESDLQFEEINGKVGFPIIEKLGQAGFNDPYNFTYKKTHMRGERYGYGINLFDGVGASGFVTKAPTLENFQFPNRRDVADSDTQNYSLFGTVKASDVTNNPTQTHEVFDMDGAYVKNDICSFKNIIRRGETLGLSGSKAKSKVTAYCDEEDGEIENHGATVTVTNRVYPYYHPYTPVRDNDPDVTGHNYIVNPEVGHTNNPLTGITYRPPGFAPNYFSQGLLLAGVDNFPDWAKAFSVVRTNAAGRVVAQGFASYALDPAVFRLVGEKKLMTKDKRKFWIFFPDIENGIVSSDSVNDVIANPQNYKIQFVSPLGFFSEVYSFENNTVYVGRDRLVDQICYARMIRDVDGGLMNPNEDPNMGVGGGDGYRYVAFNKWRNTGQNNGAFASLNGNNLFDIAVVNRKADGRGTYLEVELTHTGGSFDRDFNDSGLKDWTEPVYMVNLVSEGAIITDKNVEKYKPTGHYQKLESIVGQGNGLPDQKFLLVDERWEDCIPALNSSYPTSVNDVYCYIKHPNGAVEKWINVTFKTAAQIAQIIADIAAFGSYTGGVTGLYTHTNINGENRFFELNFNIPNFYPQQDDKILVRYDKRFPIRVFGGDSVIGESIFAPIDREADAHDKAATTQFAVGIGFPYRHFEVNPRQYIVKSTDFTLTSDVIQDTSRCSLGYWRQLCWMFTVESRINTPYAFNAQYPLQFFPLINYVIRPNRWDKDKDIVGNNIYPQYVDDYGADEITRWRYGGFRFLQQVNPDYSNEPSRDYFSRPEFGFVEKTEFCTRVMWSLPRAINVQDAPGLRTFPANNAYDLDDNQGEIKKAWDAMSSKGENLYAFCNSGICLLITKKSILSDINSSELGLMASDLFINAQYWINKDIGMFDETWRAAAESYTPITLDANGSQQRVEAIFFINNESVFVMINNDVTDIGRIKYHNTLYPAIKNILPGYQTHLAGVFDKYNQEYWLHIQQRTEDPNVDDLFMFSQRNNRWIGHNDYKFDRFVTIANDMFAQRDGETYELGKGFLINGQPVEFEVTAVASPEQFWDKEFIRVRINSPENQKPTRVEFFRELNGTLQLIGFLDSSQGALYLKNYRGWEQFIPRIIASADVNRRRAQGRLILYKIIHNLQSDFKVVDSSIQYKLLK